MKIARRIKFLTKKGKVRKSVSFWVKVKTPKEVKITFYARRGRKVGEK